MHSFSLGRYLLVVFALSWPFQLIMAGVGTFVVGRYVFRDGFQAAGWRWGKPRYYILAFALALFLWLAPVLLEGMFGIRPNGEEPSWDSLIVTFAASFGITLLPASGEEFSWRGYLLPRLMEQCTSVAMTR